ncbi:hypothetical protein HMPREF0262_00009 [Clostridium sp. ATCC 29733]|nr:hypothetical protein HMPREF0262_00009 [Clostridium sp. ATCC 29733]
MGSNAPPPFPPPYFSQPPRRYPAGGKMARPAGNKTFQARISGKVPLQIDLRARAVV